MVRPHGLRSTPGSFIFDPWEAVLLFSVLRAPEDEGEVLRPSPKYPSLDDHKIRSDSRRYRIFPQLDGRSMESRAWG